MVHVVAMADTTSGTDVADSGSISLLPVKTWNPLLTGSLSAVLPGAGQAYTGHYIKAGSFLALEVITALVARSWYNAEKVRNTNADFYEQSSLITSGKTDSLSELEKAALWRFDAFGARYSMYNSLSWMIGGYIYNVLDAVACSKFFVSDEEKSPAKAAWLSAIPGLGLGQLYNGAPGKAGMIFMTQMSLGVIAVNEHRLMRKAEAGITALNRLNDSTTVEVVEEYKQDWEFRQGVAFRNRNTYLWYSLFFYVYGILDAIVDAHLHDYPKKIRAYPDLVAHQSAAGITLEYIF
ncbi:MAG: hypothetical protein JXB48_22370 [Candidatus Latescibacteria bacterium]|nr:hypothetical protein [Candidatus Latescibacterota bacterium]